MRLLAAVFPILAAAPAGAALAGAAVGECPAGSVATATQPAQRRSLVARFRDRFALLDRALRTAGYDVLMIGESHVALWPPDAARRAFGDARILNAGAASVKEAVLAVTLARIATFPMAG